MLQHHRWSSLEGCRVEGLRVLGRARGAGAEQGEQHVGAACPCAWPRVYTHANLSPSWCFGDAVVRVGGAEAAMSHR